MTTYVITDLEGFAQLTRKNVAESFTENYTENLDDFISIQQVIGIIEENSYGKTENNKIIISEDNFNNIFDHIRVRLYEVGLAKLASQGLLECAWNTETNQMEFWSNEQHK